MPRQMRFATLTTSYAAGRAPKQNQRKGCRDAAIPLIDSSNNGLVKIPEEGPIPSASTEPPSRYSRICRRSLLGN